MKEVIIMIGEMEKVGIEGVIMKGVVIMIGEMERVGKELEMGRAAGRKVTHESVSCNRGHRILSSITIGLSVG